MNWQQDIRERDPLVVPTIELYPPTHDLTAQKAAEEVAAYLVLLEMGVEW